MDRSLEDLRDQFFRLLDQGVPDGTALWHEVWRLLVCHPWYKAELHRAAMRVLRGGQAPGDWAQGIEQEAIVLLAEQLRGAADLGVNRDLAVDHFAGWLATIALSDCRRALRAMRRARRRAGSQRKGVEAAAAANLPMDEIIDLSLAISKLPEEIRNVLRLRLRGCGIVEIAERLQTSRSRVGRLWQAALRRLRREG